MRRKKYSTRPKGVSHEDHVASCREWAIAVHKAKMCLVGYMKDVHGRNDGMTSLAIEDFAHDKGYYIPNGKSNARWLTELFLSGEDEHISRTSIYFSHKKLDAEYTEEEIRESIVRMAENWLLGSFEGREHLALCKEQASIRGVDWFSVHAEINRNKSKEKEDESLPLKDRYRKYLLSPEWRAFREGVIKARGEACEKCNSTERLQVHHITYERIFREIPEDVEVLCRECHKKEHGIS